MNCGLTCLLCLSSCVLFTLFFSWIHSSMQNMFFFFSKLINRIFFPWFVWFTCDLRMHRSKERKERIKLLLWHTYFDCSPLSALCSWEEPNQLTLLKMLLLQSRNSFWKQKVNEIKFGLSHRLCGKFVVKPGDVPKFLKSQLS